MHNAACSWHPLLRMWLPYALYGRVHERVCEAGEAGCYAFAAVVQLQAATASQADIHSVRTALHDCVLAVREVVDGRPAGLTTSLQPWQRPLLQMHAALLVMVAACSEAALGPAVVGAPSPPEAHPTVHTSPPNHILDAVSACLCVLEVAPPGTEPLTLRVLSTLTRLDVLRALRGVASAFIQHVQDEVPALATAVAWGAVVSGQVRC